MSIRKKLILSICIPMILGFAALLLWDYQHSYQRATEFAEQRVAERATATASQLNEKLESIKFSADAAAEYFQSRNTLLEPQLRGMLAATMRPGNWVNGAVVAFAQSYQRGPRIPQAAGMRRPQGGPGSPGGPAERGLGERGPGEKGLGDKGNNDRGPNDRNFNVENLEVWFRTRGYDDAWFMRPRDSKKGTWIDPDELKFPNVDANKICAYSVPFYTNNDTFAGVIAVCVLVSDLQHLRDEPENMLRFRGANRRLNNVATSMPTESKPTPLTDGGYVILDQHGNLISHPDGKLINDFSTLAEKLNPDFGEAIHKALKGEGDIVTVNNLDQLIPGYATNEEYVLAVEPIPSSGWVFVTAVPKSELLGPIQRLLLQRAVLFSVMMFFPIGIVAFVSRRFCKPIEKLAGRVQDISQGNLDVKPIEVNTKDEIGRLAGGFNSMTEQLRSHIAALTEQSAAREKVESELRIARKIQSDLLPRTFPPFPDRAEFDLHALNVPARHIAGDFFDFFFVDSETMILVIADVSGKGVPAALLMAVSRTIIRNLAIAGMSPVQIIKRANKMLIEDSDPGMFVTMFLASYKTSSGEMSYVNAGHPDAIAFSRSGESKSCCGSTGPIVGVDADGEMGQYVESKITLKPGEGLLLYTDGITEAWDGNEFFGEKKLIAEMKKHAIENCSDICTKLSETVTAFQGHQLSDDMTILAIRRNY